MRSLASVLGAPGSTYKSPCAASFTAQSLIRFRTVRFFQCQWINFSSIFKMLKLVVLLAAVLACASAAPAVVSAPALVARIAPAPEAPANTAHATHVAAVAPIAPIVPLTYAAAPVAYSAYPYSVSAPLTASPHFYVRNNLLKFNSCDFFTQSQVAYPWRHTYVAY
ncbi:hypothetical protein DMENIID0001_168570 [Sergentomyia squamirostris]